MGYVSRGRSREHGDVDVEKEPRQTPTSEQRQQNRSDSAGGRNPLQLPCGIAEEEAGLPRGSKGRR